jgi:hypothetical protein
MEIGASGCPGEFCCCICQINNWLADLREPDAQSGAISNEEQPKVKERLKFL